MKIQILVTVLCAACADIPDHRELVQRGTAPTELPEVAYDPAGDVPAQLRQISVATALELAGEPPESGTPGDPGAEVVACQDRSSTNGPDWYRQICVVRRTPQSGEYCTADCEFFADWRRGYVRRSCYYHGECGSGRW